jgi:glyoxylate reductase
MKRGAILVNVSRGDLIDTPALIVALQNGTICAAALDVCDPEPIPRGHPLLGIENVLATSHIASVSPKAVRRLRETAAKTALAALLGNPLPNVVNSADLNQRSNG